MWFASNREEQYIMTYDQAIFLELTWANLGNRENPG
jgi:hypothetical protein